MDERTVQQSEERVGRLREAERRRQRATEASMAALADAMHERGRQLRSDYGQRAQRLLLMANATFAEANVQAAYATAGEIRAAIDTLLSETEEGRRELEFYARRYEQESELLQEIKKDIIRARFEPVLPEEAILRALEIDGWDMQTVVPVLVEEVFARDSQQIVDIIAELRPSSSVSLADVTSALHESGSMSSALAFLLQLPITIGVDTSLKIVSTNLTSELADLATSFRNEMRNIDPPYLIVARRVESIVGDTLTKSLTKSQSRAGGGATGRRASPVETSDGANVDGDMAAPNDENLVEVSPVPENARVSISCPQDIVDCNQTVQVNFFVPTSVFTRNDWIAMYRSGQIPTHRITWDYAYKGNLQTQDGVTTGMIRFTTPSSFVGEVVFAYYANSSTMYSAISNAIHVGPKFSMSVSKAEDTSEVFVHFGQQFGIECPNGWVGMYDDPSKPNDKYTEFQWLSASSDHATLSFRTPKSGYWDFRLFPFRTYMEAACCSLSFAGKNTVQLHQYSGRAVVTCDIETYDCERDGIWLGLYRVEERDNRQWRRSARLDDGGPALEISFKLPIHYGTYEVRVFAHNSYDQIVCTSNSITVGGL